MCVISAIVAVVHLYFGYVKGPIPHLAFALPVTVMVLVATGLGFWLGWIMATTKEPEPAQEPAIEDEEELEEAEESETPE